MKLNGKAVDLVKLGQEAVAAGVAIPRGLSTTATDLMTYDTDGHQVEPPAGMAPVLAAHTPDPPPPTPVYGPDAADLQKQAAAAVSQLRSFIALAPPTNADVVNNAKMQNRVLLAIIQMLRPAGLP